MVPQHPCWEDWPRYCYYWAPRKRTQMHDSQHKGLGKKSDKQLYLPKIRFDTWRAGQQRQNNPREIISNTSTSPRRTKVKEKLGARECLTPWHEGTASIDYSQVIGYKMTTVSFTIISPCGEMGRCLHSTDTPTVHTPCCCYCRRQMMKMKSRATLRSASQLSCAGCRVSTGSSVSETKGKSWWSGLKLELWQISGHIFTAPFLFIPFELDWFKLADLLLPPLWQGNCRI